MRLSRKGKTSTFEVSVCWNPVEQAIHLASREAGKFVLTVNHDPTSLRGHPKLFRELAKDPKTADVPAPE
jgi:hypothetical protein